MQGRRKRGMGKNENGYLMAVRRCVKRRRMRLDRNRRIE